MKWILEWIYLNVSKILKWYEFKNKIINIKV